jgi:hypothetical protein
LCLPLRSGREWLGALVGDPSLQCGWRLRRRLRVVRFVFALARADLSTLIVHAQDFVRSIIDSLCKLDLREQAIQAVLKH